MGKKYLSKCCGHHSIFKMLITLKLMSFLLLFSVMVAFAQQPPNRQQQVVSVSGKIQHQDTTLLVGITLKGNGLAIFILEMTTIGGLSMYLLTRILPRKEYPGLA